MRDRALTLEEYGGDDRIRTGDPLLAKQVRRLSPRIPRARSVIFFKRFCERSMGPYLTVSLR